MTHHQRRVFSTLSAILPNMFKLFPLQIAVIALLGTLILSLIFSEQILDKFVKYRLSWEVWQLSKSNTQRNRSRTQVEIDRELSNIVSILEWGDTEQNTDLLIEILQQRIGTQALRLAIDLTYHKTFIRHVHPREQLLEFVAACIQNNPTLLADVADNGRQIGLDLLANFTGMSGGQQ